MPHKELEALYDNASFEEAQAITAALVAERRELKQRHPDTQFPGKPAHAVYISLLTATAGMGRVAEREAVLAQEVGKGGRVQQIREVRDQVLQELAEVA